LFSCVAKLMEQLVNKCQHFFLEQSNAFRTSQGGFRPRSASIDQVTRLDTTIRDGLRIKVLKYSLKESILTTQY
jgi:hypothetical protein